MAADPDHDLVARSRAGDLDAFGSLVARHRDVVFRVASRIVGPDDAPDVSQDAFLRALHRLDRFRGDGPFRAWLLAITYNAALREAGTRRPEPVDLADTDEPERVGGGAHADRTPATTLERRERRERLEGKIAMLTPRHRAVLVLRDVEGLSYDDIASVTETPLGSVKGRLHRARNELIELLRANTYDWELPGERSGDDEDALSPAQQRLRGHLELLGDDAPDADPAVVGEIVRRARWQRAVRAPVLTAGHLLAALLGGLGLAVGLRSGEGER